MVQLPAAASAGPPGCLRYLILHLRFGIRFNGSTTGSCICRATTLPQVADLASQTKTELLLNVTESFISDVRHEPEIACSSIDVYTLLDDRGSVALAHLLAILNTK